MCKNNIVDYSKLKYFDDEEQAELKTYKSKALKLPAYKDPFGQDVGVLYYIIKLLSLMCFI